MRLFSVFLGSLLLLYACTQTPVDPESNTIHDLGFEWRVPYALTLAIDSLKQPLEGQAVFIDATSVLLEVPGLDDAGAIQPGDPLDEWLESDFLLYEYDPASRRLALKFGADRFPLGWGTTSECWRGDLQPGWAVDICNVVAIDPS